MPTIEYQPLAHFAESRDEAAFARVVADFGGLVFTSARRRTGDTALAEEIAQNVFAIAARKARKLSTHPSLTAWFYTTVRLESAKALRARQRHQRRVEALAGEMKSQTDAASHQPMPAAERESWRDALPLLDESLDRLPPADRELVLGRFFEDRSFRDIAESSGRSEGACKMRLRRALGKLNTWLTGRGVTLSSAALASGLAAEFSKAVPASVATSLPAKSVVASTGVGGATILTNTLQTMSTIKTTGLAAVGIFALGVLPVAMQQTEAKRLGEERGRLQERAAALGIDTRPSIHDRRGTGKIAPGAEAAGVRPVARYLAQMDRPIDADQLIEQIVSAAMSRDMAEIMRVLLPMAKLTPGQGEQVLADVRASGKSQQMKDMALQMLSMMVHQPEGSPGESLDRNLSDGVDPMNLANRLGEWVQKDSEAAIEWFVSRRDAGKLTGKGVSRNPEAILLVGLVDGLAAIDPTRAIALLDGADPDARTEGIQSIAARLAADEATRAQALSLVKSIGVEKERARAAESAASQLARRSLLGEAAAFVDGADLTDGKAAAAIARVAVIPGGESASRGWDERVAWAIAHSAEGARAELVRELTSNGYNYHPPKEISAWIDAMPPGAERDAGLAAEAGALFVKDMPEKALARAGQIGEQAVRDDVVRRVFIWVNHRSAEAAAQLARDHGMNLDDILTDNKNR